MDDDVIRFIRWWLPLVAIAFVLAVLLLVLRLAVAAPRSPSGPTAPSSTLSDGSASAPVAITVPLGFGGRAHRSGPAVDPHLPPALQS